MGELIAGRTYETATGPIKVLADFGARVQVEIASGHRMYMERADVLRKVYPPTTPAPIRTDLLRSIVPERLGPRRRRRRTWAEVKGLTLSRAWTIGFLAARGRVHAFVPPWAEDRFVDGYEQVVGLPAPAPGTGGLCVLQEGVNKYGTSLVVRFRAAVAELGRFDLGDLEPTSPYEDMDVYEVSSCLFVWWLFRVGFTLGRPDPARVRARLEAREGWSPLLLAEFDAGVKDGGNDGQG